MDSSISLVGVVLVTVAELEGFVVSLCEVFELLDEIFEAISNVEEGLNVLHYELCRRRVVDDVKSLETLRRCL